jgi:hypothetical protein
VSITVDTDKSSPRCRALYLKYTVTLFFHVRICMSYIEGLLKTQVLRDISRCRWACGYRLQRQAANKIFLELLDPEEERTLKLRESITQRRVISGNTWVFGNRAGRNSITTKAFLLYIYLFLLNFCIRFSSPKILFCVI